MSNENSEVQNQGRCFPNFAQQSVLMSHEKICQNIYGAGPNRLSVNMTTVPNGLTFQAPWMRKEAEARYSTLMRSRSRYRRRAQLQNKKVICSNNRNY
jgi:hypothetical protein